MISSDNEWFTSNGRRPETDQNARPINSPATAPSHLHPSLGHWVRVGGGQFVRGVLVYAGMVTLSATLWGLLPPSWSGALPGSFRVSVEIIRCPESSKPKMATLSAGPAPSGKEVDAVAN
jgi:hypothetical protein